VLEAYCNWLENRVVARFDAAVAEANLRLQAQSVSIMIELDKERSIAQVSYAVDRCTAALHLASSYFML
jgi:NifU-like protein involved in Fe-S cluster formation